MRFTRKRFGRLVPKQLHTETTTVSAANTNKKNSSFKKQSIGGSYRKNNSIIRDKDQRQSNNNNKNIDPATTNKNLTEKIQDLLNELNFNGERVNECSKQKTYHLKQLEKEMNQISEMNTIPVLQKYFEILFLLERCQLKIEEHQLERSDILTEMYMTQQIILNMLQMKHSKSVNSLLINLKKKLNPNSNNSNSNNNKKKLNSVIISNDDTNYGCNSSLIVAKSLFDFLHNSTTATNSNNSNDSTGVNNNNLKNRKFKKHRNCSLQCKLGADSGDIDKKRLLNITNNNDDEDNNGANDANNNIDDNNSSRNNNSNNSNNNSNNFDPYGETVERMKLKLSMLRKHRQLNENCLRELSTEFSTLKIELKTFFNKHFNELVDNQSILDRYLQYRVRANEIQTKIDQLDKLIRDHRSRYRETMYKIQDLSHTIHKSQQDLRTAPTTTTTTQESANSTTTGI